MAVELERIEFKDFQEPAVGAENLNKLQDNTQNALDKKQDTLTAGDNITIEEGVISSTGGSGGDGILTGSIIGWNDDTTIPEGYEQVEVIQIETITNENGTAIKFPDGTMICRGTKVYEEAGFTQLGGMYYRILTGITFPIPFIDVPNPSVTMNMGNIGSISTSGGITSTGIGSFSVLSANSQARAVTVFWTAIGRWK